jgi:two-component system cell cycle sensor histidine kinase/response regulator CckA
VMLQRVIGEDVSIRLELDDCLWNVQGDQSQLTQVLLNLCVNSRDAMPRGGTITILTTNTSIDQEFTSRHPGSRVGKFVRLSIADTGFGMDEETQRHIFEPFFTTKEIGKGTGLGLSMVYGIVKQLGGYVWVTSFPEGGTTFDIFLPRTKVGPEEEIAEQKLESDHTGSETILLVEDEDIVRELSRQLLESCGYDVIEASSGAAAIELVRGGVSRLDLLMTDVVMPGMSGKELAEHLAEVLPGLPVLFTSGYLEEPVPSRDASGGDLHFIQKPFSYDQLVTKVRSILDTK